MKEKLEAELKEIANKILKMRGLENVAVLQTEAKTLYERLTVLKFIERHFNESQPAAGKSEAVKKFEELAANVIKENTQVPETNPHEEDLVTPLMNTIKELVAEMPREETLDDVLADVYPNPTFIKKEENAIPSPAVVKEKIPAPEKRSLNDILKKGIHIGLNDRIGFVKHLFDGDDETFSHVLSQLNTMESKAGARNFIINVVKPDYNNWKGKEDYEARFLELIEAKFDK